ncbi:hypothetical protein ACFE04_016311 [Oxalis oulophora]
MLRSSTRFVNSLRFLTTTTTTTTINSNFTTYPSKFTAIPMDPPSPIEESEFIHVDNSDAPLTESFLNVNATDTTITSAADPPSLPEELSRNVVVLNCETTAENGTCQVYLVGTAHVSQDSCREVEAVIDFLKPEVVFLELCASRVKVLTPQSLKIPTMGEMLDMWKKNHNTFGILYSWFLAKVASRLEVFPGSEFRVAYEEAMKYGGKVILGDRPVRITLRRTWDKMPAWHKVKLVYSLLSQAVFLPDSEELNKMLKEMDDSDMLTLVIQEMSKTFPTLMETLVLERDQYMSSTLLRVACEHNSVVAVVGKGHLQGIKKHWKQPLMLNELMSVSSERPRTSRTKVLTSMGFVVAGAAIISGIYLACKK